MKYCGVTKVVVPWFDTEGMKQRSLLTIRGDITKRALFKGIRSFVKENFNKRVSDGWILKNCPIINEAGKALTMVSDPKAIGRQFPQQVEDWIKRLEEYEEPNEAEAGTDSTGTGSNAEETELPLQDMQTPNSADTGLS